MGYGIFRRMISSLITGVKYIQNQPSVKGRQGESVVSRILRQCCSSEHDHLLNNILLFDAHTGRSSQVDHILICSNGIFVIETKNYSGIIYGNDLQHEWTQILAYGNTKNKLHSPVKQNATHIYLVKQILQNKYPVLGFVVFVKNNIAHIQSGSVCTLQTLPTCIEASKPVNGTLTDDDKDAIFRRLCIHQESYAVTPREHLDHIRKLQTDLKNDICPRCGGKLLFRKGKYGKFYGCSNYPSCKFTKSIKD